jgi:hypothetical protein
MLLLNSVVRVVSVSVDEDFYRPRHREELAEILLCDYRGTVVDAQDKYCLVRFTYPRWFASSESIVTGGLMSLWVKNDDLQLVGRPRVIKTTWKFEEEDWMLEDEWLPRTPIRKAIPPIDEEVIEQLGRSRCFNCIYWTGQAGDEPTDLVCAVNIPRPLSTEIERTGGRIAYAYHRCLDFDSRRAFC